MFVQEDGFFGPAPGEIQEGLLGGVVLTVGIVLGYAVLGPDTPRHRSGDEGEALWLHLLEVSADDQLLAAVQDGHDAGKVHL